MKNTLTLVEVLAFLGAIQPNGSEAKSLPQIKGRRARTRTMYVAGYSADLAGNNGALILPSTKKQVGFTNFETGNILSKGAHLLVTGVRILFDTTAAATVLDADWTSNAPVNWLNGEVTISQDGQGVLLNTSGSDITNFKASTGNDADFRDIVPFLLRPESSFNLIAQLASAGAANQAFKLELRCIELLPDGML
ncbi:MAG TPA: hypothetical protein VF581_07755 [Flavobacterium sp.]|jgi:hypothetical protein